MSFNHLNYTFSIGKHYKKNVIFVLFSNNKAHQNDLKEKFPAAKWSQSKKCWYLPDISSIRNEIGMTPIPRPRPKKESAKVVIKKVHPVNQDALKKMHELLLLKSYSPNTIKTYCLEFTQLLYILKDIPIHTLTPEHLRSYFLYCTIKLKLSDNQIHIRINAIKFYFEQVLQRDNFFEEIPRPKKKSSLTKVMNNSDIAKLFSKTDNLKHLIIMKLCYGMGLRVSEVVNLKITDIDSKRMLLHIGSSKGEKDRLLPLPKSLNDDFDKYLLTFRPEIYLFEGQNGGQYSIRTVQAVFKNAMQKLKIKKSVGIHGVRHDYATHLLECGTDLYYMMKLLNASQN